MTFAERHDGAVLYGTAGLIACLPLLAAFAHRGYGGAILLIGIIIATRPDIWRQGVARFLRAPRRGDYLALAVLSFAAFSAWLLISGLWSGVKRPWKVWTDFTFTVLAAGALVFEIIHRTEDRRALNLLARAFVAATAAATLLLAFEAASGGALRRALPPPDPTPGQTKDLISLARGLSAVIPSLFAAAAAAILLRGRLDRSARLATGAVFALAALAAAQYSVTANSLALAAGALAFTAALFAPRATLRSLGVLIAVLTLTAPLASRIPAERIVTSAEIEQSWAQRLFIFRKAGEAAIACAPLGCGADYGRALSRSGETVVIPGTSEALPVMPLHPHNVFLQVWMDLGVPGALAFATTALFGFLALAGLDAPKLFFAAAAGAAASVTVSALIEASLWQNWRIAAAGFAAGGLALSYAFHRLHLKSAADRPTGEP